uniref:G_PROTEIN_RECEP_F1_2 domain-containing protein n=1 Tax=Elaeophora elaphi TaxID=1147741 RepID=A0A0R3RFZ2_9BILA
MYEDSELEDNIAMACIIMVALFGLISNGLSLYLTRTRSRFHNAFGILCSSFLICNLQAIFVLLIWCTVVLSLKSPILSSPTIFLVRFIGVLVNGAWFGSVLVHFFTALNRFCAFVFATKYNQLWSGSKALFVGISSWTFGVFLSIQHLYEECSFVFNQNSNYRFSYQNSFYGKICALADTTATVGLLMGMAFIDLATLVKIIAYRRTMQNNTTISTGNIIYEREVLFFKQSCILGLLYISCTAMFNTAPYLFMNRWFLFASSTITWILTQSLDGLIFLMFNRTIICKTDFTPVVTVHIMNLNWKRNTEQ